jgi:hypothetical protein
MPFRAKDDETITGIGATAHWSASVFGPDLFDQSS